MHERYGQLAKKIVGRALPPLGALRLEHEVPVADAQAGDAYFEPRPGVGDGERAPLGWLGRMTREPCLLEMIQNTPGPRAVRSNVRKQLSLDHARLLEAQKQKERRVEPPFVHLWMISAGRPDDVLDGYDFRRARGWPRGFWVRSRLDAVGLVVLPELPRRRDTLLLRLLGRDRVLREAIDDLRALPVDTLEYSIAYEVLVALKFEVADNEDNDEEMRAIVTATEQLIEHWKKQMMAEGRVEGLAKGLAKGRVEGLAEGHMQALVRIYEARFEPMPARMKRALAAKVTEESGLSWVTFFATAASASEIAAAIRKGTPTH